MLRFIDFYKGIKVVFKKEFTGEQAIKLNNFSKTFYLNVRVTRVIEIFHSLAYPLHGHDGQGGADLRQEKGFSSSSSMCEKAGVQALEPCSAAFLSQ